MHAVNRISHSYEHIPPESVGNVRRVLISELSGRSNIMAKTTKFRIEEDGELQAKILGAVQDLEHDGYQFEAAEASFDLLVMKQAGTYKQTFELDHYRVNVVNQSREPVTDAVIKLRVGDDAQLVVGEGDGFGSGCGRDCWPRLVVGWDRVRAGCGLVAGRVKAEEDD